MKPMLRSVLLGTLAAVRLCTTPVFAQEVGQVTTLPVPRFVSMNASEGRVRRGPSLARRLR